MSISRMVEILQLPISRQSKGMMIGNSSACTGEQWMRPNERLTKLMQLTPLRNDKIVAILAARCGKNTVPIYQCAAAEA